ncbi:MAG: ATP-grasp domain-containing protein [Gammaproteobacteria bacterium]|nr:ATP-grasp domain-containing protein [Gammaproteobacteria bacterium]
MNFRRILVANRGEIACRVMRTARTLGYRTVAVYSEADASAPHVTLADEAVLIGAGPTAESYLRVDRLIDAARRTGAEAIHPGYGFLSERADFAQACADAGIVFIGPPSEAIKAMGDKAGAKRRMLEAGVPCAPGYLGEDQSEERLTHEGDRLGVPLLVKAVAGGGGRGMRLVHSLLELPAALAGARREAQSAFGDGTLMLERLIEGGRHIEIQVFADQHGNVIHLGERDCTAQRRRQKVIEEAPSPVVSPEMRERMGEDAVAAALAVGYVGAGTVEFIVDAELRHYFLEMNTRLQVEHPVTEFITGLDLVEWQIRVAAGDPLPLRQEEVRFCGHAIEARLYAEDPYAGFAPQTGRVLHWRPEEALRPGVRIDSGIVEGGQVPPFYDAMVAKVIAHGRARADAIRRLSAALEDAPLVGLKNNGRFLRDLLAHPAFVEARMNTSLLDEWAAKGEPLLVAPAVADGTWRLAAAVLASRDGGSRRPASVASWDLTLQSGEERRTLRVRPHARRVDVSADGTDASIELLSWDGHELRYMEDGVARSTICLVDGVGLQLAQDGAVVAIGEVSPWPSSDSATDPRLARAPVAGTIAAISVAPGDVVAAGQQLVCVEAMKMEMWLVARSAGRVRAVHAQVKESVEAGAVLVELEIEENG